MRSRHFDLSCRDLYRTFCKILQQYVAPWQILISEDKRLERFSLTNFIYIRVWVHPLPKPQCIQILKRRNLVSRCNIANSCYFHARIHTHTRTYTSIYNCIRLLFFPFLHGHLTQHHASLAFRYRSKWIRCQVLWSISIFPLIMSCLPLVTRCVLIVIPANWSCAFREDPSSNVKRAKNMLLCVHLGK